MIKKLKEIFNVTTLTQNGTILNTTYNDMTALA